MSETVALVGMGLALGCAAYAYVAYPVLLALVGRFRRREPVTHDNERWPHITVTLPVYNEEAEIEEALDYILKSDYPPDRRHVLVISDASTDRTDEIVRGYADRGVRLIRLPERAGKTAAENAARAHFVGDIVVNTDASVRIHPHGLKALVAAFADPTVGVASGHDVSVARSGGTANIGESGYVGYEMWVRELETRVDGIVGASGCFYASRKDLHGEIVPEALSRDFATPLIARQHGYRSVSVRDAVCFVPRTGSLHREFHRKVRTMARGLETLFHKRQLLNPFRYGWFTWMLFSHKLVRWLVPWAVVVGGMSVAVLSLTQWWARWLLVAGLAAMLLAIVGWFWPRRRPIPPAIAGPSYVGAGVVAGLSAWLKALRGELNPTWEPTRRENSALTT